MLDVSKEAVGEDLLICDSCLSDLFVISKYGISRAYRFGVGCDFSKSGGAHRPNEYKERAVLVK